MLRSGADPVTVHTVVGAEGQAAALEAVAGISANPTVSHGPFSAELRGELLSIADELKEMVPLLRLLVEAQTRLGGNAAASVTLLPIDAQRIAELTADNLAEEAGSSSPKMGVVEHCLRVGRALLLIAMELTKSVVLAIDGALAFEALTDPTTAHAHAQAAVASIEHALLKLF
jgi:hypothetical protein